MSAMASKVTSISIVYPTVCSRADQRKHQRYASLAFVRGIHWWPVNTLHKGPVMWKMFLFDDVIMRKIYCLQYLWTEISLIWVQQCAIYYTYLYPFHAGISNARNATKIQESCFRYKKNTWHVDSNFILQPPTYLIIIINWFIYMNNYVTKDRCSISTDMTVVLGLHKTSLQAMYSFFYTSSINCGKNILLELQQN